MQRMKVRQRCFVIETCVRLGARHFFCDEIVAEMHAKDDGSAEVLRYRNLRQRRQAPFQERSKNFLRGNLRAKRLQGMRPNKGAWHLQLVTFSFKVVVYHCSRSGLPKLPMPEVPGTFGAIHW